MEIWGATAAFLLAFGIVAFLTPRLLVHSLRKRWVDPPGERKIHTMTASRLGGFAFFPAIVLAVGLSAGAMSLFGGGFEAGTGVRSILGGCALAILFGLGAADDLRGVRYRKKLLFQLLAAGVAAGSGIWIRQVGGEAVPPQAGIPLSALLLVFVMNAVNLIDGLDGLASLLSIEAFGIYGAALAIGGGGTVELLTAFAALGALIPFFYFNVFRVSRKNDSKIFMGDTGSLLVGFLSGTLAICLWNEGADGEWMAPVVAFSLLSIPCGDALRVFGVRILGGRPLFLADNSHIHHRLLAQGYSPTRILITLTVAQILLLGLNLALGAAMPLAAVAAVDGMVLFVAFRLTDRRKK